MKPIQRGSAPPSLDDLINPLHNKFGVDYGPYRITPNGKKKKRRSKRSDFDLDLEKEKWSMPKTTDFRFLPSIGHAERSVSVPNLNRRSLREVTPPYDSNLIANTRLSLPTVNIQPLNQEGDNQEPDDDHSMESIANLFRQAVDNQERSELTQGVAKEKDREKGSEKPRFMPLEQVDIATSTWMRKHAIKPKRHLDSLDQAHYHMLFNLLDSDRSGTLEIVEVADALQFLGLQCSEQDLKTMWCMADANYDGKVTFDEFASQFATRSEWDSLFQILRQTRLQNRHKKAGKRRKGKRYRRVTGSKTTGSKLAHKEKTKSEVIMPFTLWVPAYHRGKIFEKMTAAFP